MYYSLFGNKRKIRERTGLSIIFMTNARLLILRYIFVESLYSSQFHTLWNNIVSRRGFRSFSLRKLWTSCLERWNASSTKNLNDRIRKLVVVYFKQFQYEKVRGTINIGVPPVPPKDLRP